MGVYGSSIPCRRQSGTASPRSGHSLSPKPRRQILFRPSLCRLHSLRPLLRPWGQFGLETVGWIRQSTSVPRLPAKIRHVAILSAKVKRPDEFRRRGQDDHFRKVVARTHPSPHFQTDDVAILLGPFV